MKDNFDDTSFWDKLSRYARVAGREVIEKALWLYYAAQSSSTPQWAKSVIYGALVYFILPVDAIPDVIPLAGYTDDLGALAAAVASVALYIDEEVRQKATRKLADWFGPDDDPGDAEY